MPRPGPDTEAGGHDAEANDHNAEAGPHAETITAAPKRWPRGGGDDENLERRVFRRAPKATPGAAANRLAFRNLRDELRMPG